MVDYKPKWMPEKTANLTQSPNAWGTHDRVFFSPAEDTPLRCAYCNRLNDIAAITTEGACMMCNRRWTKAEARDMYVEAKQVKVVTAAHSVEMGLPQGTAGWCVQVLQHYARLPAGVSATLSPNWKLTPIGEVARNMTAQALRQQDARRKLTAHLRNQSGVSRALKGGVFGDRPR